MSGDAEVSDGFQGGVHEKLKWSLLRQFSTVVSRSLCSQLSSNKTFGI